MKAKITTTLLVLLMLAGMKNVNAQCVTTAWYADADGDGHGVPTQTPLMSCIQPAGYSADSLDYDDNNACSYYEWGRDDMNAVITYTPSSCDNGGIFTITLAGSLDGIITCWEHPAYGGSIEHFFEPDQTQVEVQSGSTIVFGYTRALVRYVNCTPLPGRSFVYTSFRSQTVNVPFTVNHHTYYVDADGDGYGDPTISFPGCSVPAGYVSNNWDENDNNSYMQTGIINNCPDNISVAANTGSCNASVNFETPFIYEASLGYGDTTFHYASYYQPWIVPDHVYSINVDAVGFWGQGTGESFGGAPGRVQTRLAVTPGETLYIGLGNITTGGAGATNPVDEGDAHGFLTGGQGGNLVQLGRTGTLFGDTLIVAGGGGGGVSYIYLFEYPHWNGGNGGWVAAVDPNPGDADFMHGLDGVDSRTEAAGGGGAGFKGGGTTNYTGGGGGSSHVAYAGTSKTLFTEGYTGGDSYLRITYFKQYDMVQTAGLPAGSPFPIGTTPVAFEYTNSNGELLICSFDVTVNGTLQTWYLDADNDGHYLSSTSAYCKPADGYNTTATSSGDCDDNDNTKWQSATLYIDSDNDNYDNGTATVCYGATIPAGYKTSTLGTDCNDASASIHPGATEICGNGIDDNCNGTVDEGCITYTYYFDGDHDGYGKTSEPIISNSITPPAGYAASGGDCDDTKPSVHPGAAEVCDGLDNNCNGSIDEGLMQTWYRDADGDSYGNAAISIMACSKPAGYVNNKTDCNDGKATVYPGAPEICDGFDNNCNGKIDEGVPGITYYRDKDGDGYGNAAITITVSCNTAVPKGYVSNNTDCNDANANVRPGAVEICDGIDNNCNGQIDENCNVCKNATGLTVTDITSGKATLKWAANINPAEWQVQYKSTASGSKWKDVSPTPAPSARSVTISELTTGQTYNWRIKAKCGKDWTSYADGPSFKTLATLARTMNAESTVEEQLQGFKVYPNPSNGQFMVDLHLAEKINTTAKIELIDLTGRTVYIRNITFTHGLLQQRISVSSLLAPGIYTVRIIADNKIYFTKLVYEK